MVDEFMEVINGMQQKVLKNLAEYKQRQSELEITITALKNPKELKSQFFDALLQQSDSEI